MNESRYVSIFHIENFDRDSSGNESSEGNQMIRVTNLVGRKISQKGIGVKKENLKIDIQGSDEDKS